MAYTSRNNELPHPMYGITQPGYCIADLPSGTNSGTVALDKVSEDTTSVSISHGANGIELNAQFGDGSTTCSIDVTGSKGNLIRTFTNVSKFNAQGLFIGYGDNGILLGGDPVTVRAYNFTGGGKVTVKVRKTS